MCYGWGEEYGIKYWILQNSWGPQWGENGSFRIKRGTDESGIESMVEAADPFVINRLSIRENKQKNSKSEKDS